MNYDEFLRHIGNAGMKRHEFATLMDMSHVSISNYRKQEDVPRHFAMIAALLGEMVERGSTYGRSCRKSTLAPRRSSRPEAGSSAEASRKRVESTVLTP